MTRKEKEEFDIMKNDAYFADGAYALYGGGWRKEDIDDLIYEHNMTKEEAEKYSKFFELLEKEIKEKNNEQN